MKQIHSKRFDETIYQTTLDNGLTILLVHKPEFKSSVALLGTNFGAKHLTQKIDGKLYTYHSGVAHFLEHKLFEKEDEDVLSWFTNMGAQANAFTSYNETVYYFSTPNDIKEPLMTLLDFVQSIQLTEEGVIKEQGIITEEAKMYYEMPFFRLSYEMLESLFINHPLKHDIVGSQEDILKMTKDELELAYETNYHPSQMVLSIVTPTDPQIILEMVNSNQKEKSFKEITSVKTPLVDEPIKVARPYHDIAMNVQSTKLGFAYKQSLNFENELEAYRFNLIVSMILDILFSKLNPDYQKWLDSNLINDVFAFQSDFGLDYGYIQFISETEEIDELKNLIEQSFVGPKFDNDVVNQIKKRYFGDNISQLSDFESFAISNFRSHFINTNSFEILEMLETISIDDLYETVKQLNFKHCAQVVIRTNNS